METLVAAVAVTQAAAFLFLRLLCVDEAATLGVMAKRLALIGTNLSVSVTEGDACLSPGLEIS